MQYRILHLLPSLTGGGAERQMAFLSSRMHLHGFESHIGYLYEGPSFYSGLLSNCHLHRLQAASNHSILLLPRICRLIRQVKPDIIQTWITQMDVVGGYASVLMGVPWVLREPSAGVAHEFGWKNRLREIVAAHCSGIIANSFHGLDYWKQQHIDVPMTVIRNGFDVEHMARLPATDVAVFGLDKAKPLILFAGRFSQMKNLGRMIAAFKRIQVEIDAQLLLCGDGAMRVSLEEQAGKGLNKTIFFSGSVPSHTLWGLMKSADIFCFVSTYEGMPNAVVEAGLCGAPLIVSDIPAHREIVDDLEAIFVDPYDTDKIESALRSCLKEKKETERRRQLALKKLKIYSLDTMACSFSDFYKKVI